MRTSSPRAIRIRRALREVLKRVSVPGRGGTVVNFNNIWAVASMERRQTRRLVRYWVFLSIAYLFGLGLYFYYSTLHALFSSLSASVGMIQPRFLVTAIALFYLAGFVLGIVF